VVLVDEADREVGISEKLEAHRDGGRLHRAFSVFLFDDEGRLLLQQRARAKYHFALRWTNSCCGHPRPGEDLAVAAQRRVREELGVDPALRRLFSFVYEATDEASGLTEREFDHVFVGRLTCDPAPAPEEVADFAWRHPSEILADVSARAARYTPWFAPALRELAKRSAR